MCEKCDTELSYRPVNGNGPLTKSEVEHRINLGAEHFQKFLRVLGFDLGDPNMSGTPQRVAKMYMEELFRGTWEPRPKITIFDLPEASLQEEMIIVGPITVKSMCSHHLMPIVGECYIGVILGQSSKGVPGLSKYARIVEWFARRPQIQEQLVLQIKEDLIQMLNIDAETGGVCVVIKASHGCMTHRGVNETECMMSTPTLYGKFMSSAVRSEFYTLAGIK